MAATALGAGQRQAHDDKSKHWGKGTPWNRLALGYGIFERAKFPQNTALAYCCVALGTHTLRVQEHTSQAASHTSTKRTSGDLATARIRFVTQQAGGPVGVGCSCGLGEVTVDSLCGNYGKKAPQKCTVRARTYCISALRLGGGGGGSQK